VDADHFGSRIAAPALRVHDAHGGAERALDSAGANGDRGRAHGLRAWCVKNSWFGTAQQPPVFYFTAAPATRELASTKHMSGARA